MTHRPSLTATGGISLTGISEPPAAVANSIVLGQEETVALCTQRKLTQNNAGEFQDGTIPSIGPEIQEKPLNSSTMGQISNIQPSLHVNLDLTLSQSSIANAAPGPVFSPAEFTNDPNMPKNSRKSQFQGHSQNVTYGGCNLHPSKPHETIASPPLKRSLDSAEIELTSTPTDAAPHEGPPPECFSNHA